MGGDIGTRHDPIAEAKAVLMGEDLRYWAAHPEIPALMSHLIAKGRYAWCRTPLIISNRCILWLLLLSRATFSSAFFSVVLLDFVRLFTVPALLLYGDTFLAYTNQMF